MSRRIKLAASIVLFVLAVPSLGFALLMCLAAVLGSLGILADISYQENQAIAQEAALYACIAYPIGLLLLACALLMRGAYQKQPRQFTLGSASQAGLEAGCNP